MMRHSVCTLAFALFVATTRLDAQFTTALTHEPTVVPVGARVRLQFVGSIPTAFTAQKITGTPRGIAADTVYLQLSALAQPIAIPRDRVRRVELSISPGSRRNAAIQGGVITAAFMATQMWFSHQNPKSRVYEKEWQAVSIGAGMGFALGGYVVWRWNRPFEVWRDARLPE
jgi:hypothetical protein